MTWAAGDHVAVVANARLTGADRTDPFGDDLVDVHLQAGTIADIAPAGALPRAGVVLDAQGGWLIPGLWDHHVHAVQWALLTQRVPLGHADSAAHAAWLMADAPVLDDGRRIGTGFRHAFWPDAPTLEVLDAATGDVPTYLINADVHSVWLNSAALRREGHPVAGSGLLWEEPAFEISRRLNLVPTDVADAYVARMAHDAASRGVVGIVDLDMAWNADAWARRAAAGFDTLRTRFGIYPRDLQRALDLGIETGDAVDPAGLLRVGSLKVISDGSLGTRTAACSHAYPGDPLNHGLLTIPPDELVDLMIRATGGGLSCAIHAIGDIANTHALDAFALTGATGTIEHAQLVAHADVPRFAALGVGASVQPEHALDDRDLTDTVWATQTSQPYPLRALADAGANLLFGSDAPVSPLDPWAAMSAAVHRTRDGREPWQPGQAVDAATALAASTADGSSGGSALRIGGIADLAVVAHDPLTADEKTMRGMQVAATMIAGRLTHVSA
ncbi:amidohydrolase family protein [Microbacterium sp. zg-Y818]|uniref:amidohydrolase n=1 Tax=unclassified Microbacterium TaxID=2609290 RepID=UPI00214B7343|nr:MULTISPECIES: amidohydrolase family protein [unclassified Microbacterium]MCR2801018.1 amidohydrolase family protein [Microbacterium sp. zg.Y818]WIM23724.1 amidohydrolase family protein [Microbacterium sp. zg-Y818]